jgi:hypothetical protein
MRLAAHGLAVELPRGWNGRIFKNSSGQATLHAGDFHLALDDGQFGDASTSRMPGRASFLALTEYQSGAGLHPGQGLFAPHRVRLPLEPRSFSTRGLAHPRPGQAGAQHFFTSHGRPFCLYLVLAGEQRHRRRQLPVLDRILSSLKIEAG